MSGKGESVEYIREVRKAPLTKKEKDDLKAIITKAIDDAKADITIEIMLKKPPS